MKIDSDGGALALLGQFIYYGKTYPERLARVMWYCTDEFGRHLSCLETAFLEAQASDSHRRYQRGGGSHADSPI